MARARPHPDGEEVLISFRLLAFAVVDQASRDLGVRSKRARAASFLVRCTETLWGEWLRPADLSRSDIARMLQPRPRHGRLEELVGLGHRRRDRPARP